MKELWYRAPAETFTEALPVGSGRLGAMVYGQTQKEKISLNEDTLWSGYPKAENARGTYEGVQEAENLVREGKIKEAEKTIWRKCLSGWSAAYQPAGNLWIDFSHVGEVSHYRRSLDLEHAVVFTEFQSNGFSYRREVFCSYPDQVLAIRCFSNNPARQQKFLWSYPILTICVIIKIRCYIRQLRRCIRLLAILNAKSPWYMILFMKIGHYHMRLL